MAPESMVVPRPPSDITKYFYPPSLLQKHGIASFSLDDGIFKDVESAEIRWQPDKNIYENRRRENPVASAGGAIPTGWPSQLRSPLVWKGSDFSDPGTFTYTLSVHEITEIEAALENFKGLNLHFSQASKDNFPLPTLGPTMENLSVEVHRGRGFFVLRGLQPAKYSREDNVILYLGVSSYIAPRRARVNASGDMITHIVQAPQSAGLGVKVTPIFSASAQPFHADVATDVLALYTLSPAAKGGNSVISSSWAVYNELAATQPGVIATLADGEWVHNTFGHYPPFYKRPLLFYADGKPILNFSRRVITGNTQFPRDDHAPPITNEQADALDAVHFTADKHCLRLDHVAGDMLFVNNLAILHRREAFEDDGGSQRYLLRLWLRNDELGWKIPEGLRLEWENRFEPAEDVPGKWSVTPVFRPMSSACG